MNCNPCNDTSIKSCPVKDLSTDCVLYTGEDLSCSGVSSNKVLTEVIKDLDTFICNKVSSINTTVSLESVGEGSRIYKGKSLNGNEQIRSIVSSNTNFIAITEEENTISINPEMPVLSLIGDDISLDIGSVNLGKIDIKDIIYQYIQNNPSVICDAYNNNCSQNNTPPVVNSITFLNSNCCE